jgi:uncharacterized protein
MKDINAMDWPGTLSTIDERGYALIPQLLSPQECAHLRGFYDDSPLFRSVIDMKRYRFGQGEYKYFNYPLPPMIQSLREEIYTRLVPLANAWMQRLGIDMEYPHDHAALIARCHASNQRRPTPLILNYKPGGYNTLHQDLYGDVYFPFQVVFVLTQPGQDHTGGELVLTEQVPRAQSRAEVIVPEQGDAVIFTTNYRPMKGSRGYYRAVMKHGVSEVKSGERYSLGVIFHDAG